MSNKPLKASDQKKLKSLMSKKAREIEVRHTAPPYMYIFSEGTKTEPYYIKGIVKAVNEKYKELGTRERIRFKGTGHNTLSLLEYARRTVENEFPQASQVWLMYDKDDFPQDNFDNTQYSAEDRQGIRKYHVAWSNECIELWFVLHFQEMNSNLSRDRYYKMLDGHMKSYGIEEYEKNIENIYDILKDKTDLAIQRAKKQYENYSDDVPPSKRCPATRVYELVGYLMKFLD